jgi:minor extracellular serine protease Vpr
MKLKSSHIASVISGICAAFSMAAFAQPTPPDVSHLRIPGSDTVDVSGPPRVAANGTVRVVVRLVDKPLAAVAGNKRTGMTMTGDQQRAYSASLAAKQGAVMAQIATVGGTEFARMNKAHNAIVVDVNATQIGAIESFVGVASVRAAVDYTFDLSETVPYIGAAAVQALGFDGTGIRVAVLDSGIDYTHKNLGGPGTVAFYNQCYGTAPSTTAPTEAGQPRNAAPVGACANYFGPSAPKVIGGYDFLGELSGATRPDGTGYPSVLDPNPLDFQGHGTHVADIIAGRSADGTRKGVAPGAKLYAVKVCSAVATSCNGVALLQGMDFSLDPNQDGDLSDAVDVINMSLGSGYGQREDDLSAASTTAADFGVVVVVSAGNAADRPFIVGSPSSTPGVISVAQTAVPSAVAFGLVINSPAGIAGTYGNTATLDYAPLSGTVTGSVAFVGRGCLAGAGVPVGGDPYLASPAGKIALINRGVCNISEKVRRASDAGAIGVIIGLIAAGDAVSFSNGGQCPEPANGTCKPSLVITQSLANSIRTNIAAPVVASLSSANAISLAGSMASSSSRGPSMSYAAIKPEIGAPGASFSAEVGTGDGQTTFGGTSGAAPMVAGAAALLLQAAPSLQAHEVKARLMNSAENQIYTNPALAPGVLAPITRIGAGEVRVNRAIALKTGMWDAADPASVALSFGTYRVTGNNTYRRKVLVKNYNATARTYSVATNFRYANDVASGAVSLSVPATIAVPANGTATFFVTMTLNANLLPAWGLSAGANGGNGATLDLPEYDGYLTLSDATDTVRLPWHILPHKAANVVASASSVNMGGAASASMNLTNTGGATFSNVDAFYLTAESPKLPASVYPKPGDQFTIHDIKAVGTRFVDIGGGAFGVQFAISTHAQRTNGVYPGEFDIFIDTNNDGVYDFVLFNRENGTFSSTGQSVVSLLNLATGTSVVRFFTAAELVSSNIVLTASMADLGITPNTKFTFRVSAYDNYFTGALTDVVPPATITLGTPRFFVPGAFAVAPANTTTPVTINRVAAGDAASPGQTGILLLYSDGKTGAEAQAITVTP